jgi:hypothetical protein
MMRAQIYCSRSLYFSLITFNSYKKHNYNPLFFPHIYNYKILFLQLIYMRKLSFFPFISLVQELVFIVRACRVNKIKYCKYIWQNGIFISHWYVFWGAEAFKVRSLFRVGLCSRTIFINTLSLKLHYQF